MLIQKTHLQKLNSFITIACLILALSFLSIIPRANARGTGSIGPEGGTVNAGHNSSLIVPAGALTDSTQITADSFECVITTDDAAISAELNNAMLLLNSQYQYIGRLSTSVGDPSGEWANWMYKLATLVTKNITIQSKVILASTNHLLGDNEDTLANTRLALDRLNELDASMDNAVANGKMGAIARDNIKADNDDIRAALELIESLHYETLVFEFQPEGLEFLVPAELVVPWDEILYSDALFWYSGDGDVIDLIDMDYFIDDVAETVHFLIPHFSEYYYQRR